MLSGVRRPKNANAVATACGRLPEIASASSNPMTTLGEVTRGFTFTGSACLDMRAVVGTRDSRHFIGTKVAQIDAQKPQNRQPRQHWHARVPDDASIAFVASLQTIS